VSSENELSSEGSSLDPSSGGIYLNTTNISLFIEKGADLDPYSIQVG
jgi:hypothetical protein